MNVEGVRWNSVSIGAVEVTGNLKAKPRMQQPLYSCGFAHGIKRLSMTSIAILVGSRCSLLSLTFI